MLNGFLLTRVLLKFQDKSDDLLKELSAVALTPDGSLWVGSDEYITLERLTPMGNGTYGNHETFHLKDFVDLFDHDSEIDIEGIDYSDGYLWLVGSHSLKRNKTKGKKPKKDIERLSEIERDHNRFFLARLPVLKDVLDCSKDTLWDQDSDHLELLFNLPFTIGSDHAEGLTLFPCFEDEKGLMVVYDSPNENRFRDQQSIFADVFQLPSSKLEKLT